MAKIPEESLILRVLHKAPEYSMYTGDIRYPSSSNMFNFLDIAVTRS